MTVTEKPELRFTPTDEDLDFEEFAKASPLGDFDSVIGLDLSLTSTGIARHIPGRGIFVERVRSKGAKDASWLDRRKRLREITRQILMSVNMHALVMLEAPSYASIGSGTHDRSGLWWMVFDELHHQQCTIVPIAPTQRMKYATGVGGGPKASKDAVLAAAVRRYSDIDITGNDVADAVILMSMGLRLLGHPIEESLPQTHIAAMAKVSLDAS